jgi:hypothetical protein
MGLLDQRLNLLRQVTWSAKIEVVQEGERTVILQSI